MAIGVNKITSDAQSIKVGDYGSTITIDMENIEDDPVNAVEYIRLVNVEDVERKSYIDVPEHTIAENVLKIQLPHVDRGQYNVEIKDEDGRIYPAEGTLRLTLVGSTVGAKEAVYVSYKEEIISELPAIVVAHMETNKADYQGIQGEPGKAAPPKTYTRAEYDALSTYDDNTLYIVKEA